MISNEIHEILKDIICNTVRPDKITVCLDVKTNTIVIEYEDLDYEWFYEILEQVGGGGDAIA